MNQPTRTRGVLGPLLQRVPNLGLIITDGWSWIRQRFWTIRTVVEFTVCLLAVLEHVCEWQRRSARMFVFGLLVIPPLFLFCLGNVLAGLRRWRRKAVVSFWLALDKAEEPVDLSLAIARNGGDEKQVVDFSLALDEDAWFGVLDYLDAQSLIEVGRVSKKFRRDARDAMRKNGRAGGYQYHAASTLARYVEAITTARAMREGIPFCKLGGADEDEDETAHRFFMRISIEGHPLLTMQGWYKVTANGQGLCLEVSDRDDEDIKSKVMRRSLDKVFKRPFDTPEDIFHVPGYLYVLNVTVVAICQRTLIPSVVFKTNKYEGETGGDRLPLDWNELGMFTKSVLSSDCHHYKFGSMELQSDDTGGLRLASEAFSVWFDRCVVRWMMGEGPPKIRHPAGFCLPVRFGGWVGRFSLCRDPPLTRRTDFRATPSGWSLIIVDGNE